MTQKSGSVRQQRLLLLAPRVLPNGAAQPPPGSTAFLLPFPSLKASPNGGNGRGAIFLLILP